jgi:hypothetical protein
LFLLLLSVGVCARGHLSCLIEKYVALGIRLAQHYYVKNK